MASGLSGQRETSFPVSVQINTRNSTDKLAGQQNPRRQNSSIESQERALHRVHSNYTDAKRRGNVRNVLHYLGYIWALQLKTPPQAPHGSHTRIALCSKQPRSNAEPPSGASNAGSSITMSLARRLYKPPVLPSCPLLSIFCLSKRAQV